MLLNPRFISFLLAFLISTLTLVFLSFIESVTPAILFVAGLSSFGISCFMIYYAIEILVYREVNKIYDTIQRLKLKDYTMSRKVLIKNSNPFKYLNQEIFVYVAKKQKEIDELKRLEQFRREFLADVSHELKTPIFAAQGFIHTLIDGAKDDERVRDKFLLKAAKSLDGLDALVKDLVTLSQIETGAIKMHLEPVDLRAVTLDVCEQLEKRANERNVSIQIKPKRVQSVLVMADLQRIGQVMTNLIENAIKYGHENGKIIIDFVEEKKHYIISIKDDGPGILPEHQSRIFERFYRIEKSRSKEKGGTGLGLAIVKHILNGHKTKIIIMSKPDKGATFSFKLEKIDVKNKVNEVL